MYSLNNLLEEFSYNRHVKDSTNNDNKNKKVLAEEKENDSYSEIKMSLK